VKRNFEGGGRMIIMKSEATKEEITDVVKEIKR